MINILSRKLRVRDDGTGKTRETDGTFAEFENEDAIVLLGDPGMGKTTLFKEAAKTNYTTVRKFLIEPHVTKNEILFLDALDEYRTIASGQDASDIVAKALCSMNKPKFRLSCRAADWFGSADQEILSVASASGRIIVLELCPLSHEEILNALQGLVQNPVAFLDEAESVGLGKLLSNPQTLELLARAWSTEKKPRNKFEAYEIGISVLLKEINPNHLVRSVSHPDPMHLREAAGAVASILLLSNSVGIARTETADGDGYVRTADIPYTNMSALDTSLRRPLFFSPEVDRFEPKHRTIAEFIAAEDLSKRIGNGLPINRVMSLICGIDGRPVSSLRGLFAWLMCNIGDRAKDYVNLDPYGVVSYGDASRLPPSTQCAIWKSLWNLRDPWFLKNDDDRGTFRDLANLNTREIIKTILQDQTSGIHLKIAVLEAITNSAENIELNKILRDMVLEKHDNKWLRSTALRAFAKSVRNDWVQLKALDDDLAQTNDDVLAPEIRIELLRITRTCGRLALRILSIMEHAASTKQDKHIVGRFYSLINLPPDSELDEILDGAARVLTSQSKDRYAFQSIYDSWLKRRLKGTAKVTADQLYHWLRNIWGERNNSKDEATLVSLKTKFEREPSLFETVFELLARNLPEKKHAYWLFIAHDLRNILPPSVWPIPHCEFFLTCAAKEKDTERAADLFQMYMSYFPIEGGSVAITEAGLALLKHRQDIAKALGNWKSCKIEKWRKDQWKSHEQRSTKRQKDHTDNITYLTPRLTTIREGREVQALIWAAKVYQGFFHDLNNETSARDRLVSLTNNEIADAFLQGFIRYVENPDIPRKKEIINDWISNNIPWTHTLLSLSVFLRISAGLKVPKEALPDCIAVVVNAWHLGDRIPGHDTTLSAWFLTEARQDPDVVKYVLKEMWLASIKVKRGILPGLYELKQDLDSHQFLANLSIDVLKIGITEDHETVGKLVSFLLYQDQREVITLGEAVLARNEMSSEIRIIWSTALFMIDATKYLNPWQTLISQQDAAIWESIKIISGYHYDNRKALNLKSLQRYTIIASIGQRFANVGHPPNGWSGSQNPWDAAEFVANQIKMLAADISVDASVHLALLENNSNLASYHNFIKHHRAQQEKQQREASFIFASPVQVAGAIQNLAPASPNDLLAFIEDHLSLLSRELTHTQRERYRAYWNENGRNLVKPKNEEVCSGLLAEDLQNRVQAHNLIVTVEHHMVADKECDLMVLQGTERLLPIEVKHHYNSKLWTAWRTQLDRLYTRDVKTGGLGIYLVLWSGEAKGRKMPKLPKGLKRPSSADELRIVFESIIPEVDQHRLRVVVVDIAAP